MPTIDEAELIKKAESDYLETCECNFAETFSRMAERCESPIERVLLAALIAELLPDNFSTAELFGPSPLSVKTYKGVLLEYAAERLETPTVFCQATLGDYRVDFLVVCPRFQAPPHLVAIECDGHDFHERTKEQALRDKRRDRWLLKNRIFCLRFTGSEIWNDQGRCALEIADFCFKLP